MFGDHEKEVLRKMLWAGGGVNLGGVALCGGRGVVAKGHALGGPNFDSPSEE